MAIRLQITIQDEGLLDSSAFTSFIDEIEHASRNAAVIAVIRIANDLRLPENLVQLASIRIWSSEQSFFWIEELQPGSKRVIGQILATTMISTVLTSTLGESIKEGWRKTDIHSYISTSIPKIERYVVDAFHELFDGRHSPSSDKFYVQPIVIRPDRDEFLIEIQARQKQPGPTVQ